MRKNHWNMNSSSPRCNTVKCAKRCVARRCYRALRGGGSLNRNQRAAARGLSLAAYLLFSEGRERDEDSTTKNLPSCKDIHDSSLGEDGDQDRAHDAVRKQLARDVEALCGAGIGVEARGETDGRRYRLPANGFSPVELDLSREERSVLVGALRAFWRDFPYSGALRLAVANQEKRIIERAAVSPSGLRLEDPETPVNLNADQLRAVEHPGGPLLVLAGPGTGKTGVLVARIAHLVANRGVRPDRILALTFSRRAADEMSERVRSSRPRGSFRGDQRPLLRPLHRPPLRERTRPPHGARDHGDGRAVGAGLGAARRRELRGPSRSTRKWSAEVGVRGTSDSGLRKD